MMNWPKKRVKCANCGMIYDAHQICRYYLGAMFPSKKVAAECPKCGSNDYDKLKGEHIWSTDIGPSETKKD